LKDFSYPGFPGIPDFQVKGPGGSAQFRFTGDDVEGFSCVKGAHGDHSGF
jgi:hypothetical protein